MSDRPEWRICLDFGTAFSKAACAPVAYGPAETYARVRPLAIGRAAGLAAPFMAPCAVFVSETRVAFGEAALGQARASSGEGREALQSFKTILSGRGALAGLLMRVSRHIDPFHDFTLRELTVAYLAWLQVLVARAFSADMALPNGAPFVVRYTRPAWGVGEAPQTEARVARLIDEGRAVADTLGDGLLAPDGIAVSTLRPALTGAVDTNIESRVEAGVLEPVAAAVFAMGPSDHSARGYSAWVVLDMGAGTTDLAGVEWLLGEAREIVDARAGLPLAGDEIDKLVIEHVLYGARHVRALSRKTDVWRRLLTDVRSCKVELFDKGKTTLKVEGKSVTLRRRAIESDRAFRTIAVSIKQAFAECVATASRSEAATVAGVINVVVAGGGAGLGFVNEIVAHTRVRGASESVRVRVVKIGAEWLRQAPISVDQATLPQLAIAIGGAIAPMSLLTPWQDAA